MTGGAGGTYGSAKLAFHQRVRTGYLEWPKIEPGAGSRDASDCSDQSNYLSAVGQVLRLGVEM
jgi:hypothetical protein